MLDGTKYKKAEAPFMPGVLLEKHMIETGQIPVDDSFEKMRKFVEVDLKYYPNYKTIASDIFVKNANNTKRKISFCYFRIPEVVKLDTTDALQKRGYFNE